MQSEPVYRASTFKVETSPITWQHVLAGQPKAHFLQSWAWGEFKSRWGWEPTRLTMTIAQNSWQPLATAQILKRQIPRTPYNILYVPKGPALDYNDGSLRRHVLHELEELARRENAIFIKIDPDVVRSWGHDPERPSPIGSAFTKELVQRGWLYSTDQIQFPNTVELDLTQSEETLLSAMKSKTRYNIRLAERKEVIVRHGSDADFPMISQMYAETAERDEFAIRPRSYYLDAWQSFYDAGMAHPLIAEYNGTPLGAVILIRFGERVSYMYGASTNLERQRMPNYLLQWEAIRWAKAKGCALYDFWGAPTHFEEGDPLWGVWRFKAGFEGQVVQHIGAWDFPARPFMYQMYTQMMPKYLNLLRSRRAA